jgi:hypothetical protein
MIDLKTQEDKQVTKTHSHGFVLDGETGYYIDTGKDSETVTGKLMALDMATGESKVIAESAYRDVLIIRKDDILYCDAENNFHITRIDKAGGNRTELLPIDNPDYVYATEKNIMFFDYDAKWEFVEGVFGCGPNGENYTRLDE